MRERLGELLVANAKLWTPANLLVYNAPLEYRVLTSNVFDVAWAAICSSFVAETRSGIAADVCTVAGMDSDEEDITPAAFLVRATASPAALERERSWTNQVKENLRVS